MSDHPPLRAPRHILTRHVLTRRTLIGQGLAAGASGPLLFEALASRLGLPAAMAHAAAPPSFHRFTLGAFEITVISDGDLTLPVAVLLPSTPLAEAEALYAAHGRTLDVLRAEVNVTVIRTPEATIAIDCGSGTDFLPSVGRYPDNLDRAGIAPESVTHVVFTHAHPDHMWGVVDPLDGGTRFAKARHLITAAERDYWLKPGVETELPEGFRGMAIGTVRRLKSLDDRLETVAIGTEIVPGVTLIDTAGHTPGHASVLVRSGGEQMLIGGDVLTNPIVSFARPDWPWGSDADPGRGAAARRRTLDMLATDRVRLLGYHLPWPGIGRVERKDDAYRFVLG